MNRVNIAQDNYKQAIEHFAQSKKRFIAIQKMSFYLSFVLVIVSLPVAGKLMNDKDLYLEGTVWMWYLPIGFIFLYFFSKWVFRHYKKTAVSVENLLQELE